ncbi:MAG: PIN domain-containing protein [Acidimicrobiales bacterium]
MAEGYTYDASMLVACERGQRDALALHKRALADHRAVTVPAAVLAQVWRGGPQAQVSRLLIPCHVEAMTEQVARSSGTACGLAQTADVVDASVVVGAIQRDDIVVTSDEDDIKHLADSIGHPIGIRPI